MTGHTMLRVRRDIRKLEADWARGTKSADEAGSVELRKPLEDLIRAFRGIQELPPDDPRSYFRIAGYHGEPFRGAGWSNSTYWGGYCNHGNVLFPVWHRAYLLELENALRSIDGCEDVTLPYWNEVDEVTEKEGLPRIFLMRKFPLDEEQIENPLFSYKFQSSVKDNLSSRPEYDYTKHKDYETVRYPFSGLVGSEERSNTKAHNSKMKERGEEATDKLLNDNIRSWLEFSVSNWAGKTHYTGARLKYEKCLDAPNYTVFSNTTSATKWNEDHFEVSEFVQEGAPGETRDLGVAVSIETPHNALHLAIGGFELGEKNFNQVEGANGDMGENNTASFDPVFFFHHAFIDMHFWRWQKRHDRTDFLDVIEEYPGTNSADDQGPTAGVAGNTWLSMSSPLEPFKMWAFMDCEQPMLPAHLQLPEDLIAEEPPLEEIEGVIPPERWSLSRGNPPTIPHEWPLRKWPRGNWPPAQWPPQEWPHQVTITGNDVINILKIGYTYEEPPFNQEPQIKSMAKNSQNVESTDAIVPVVQVPDVNRASVAGSFTVSTWANGQLVDVNPVLSRWQVQGCANCLTHLNVRTFVPLHGWTLEEAKKAHFTFKMNLRKLNQVPFSQTNRVIGTAQQAGRIGWMKGSMAKAKPQAPLQKSHRGRIKSDLPLRAML